MCYRLRTLLLAIVLVPAAAFADDVDARLKALRPTSQWSGEKDRHLTALLSEPAARWGFKAHLSRDLSSTRELECEEALELLEHALRLDERIAAETAHDVRMAFANSTNDRL